MGEAHEVAVLQDAPLVSKVQPPARKLSDRTQRSLLEKSSNSDVEAWQERVRIHASNVHHSSGPQHAETDVAQV